MDELSFWKQKLVQAFHDPPGKPYAFFPRSGGHWALAQRLFRAFTGEDFRRYPSRPDLAASGADRPVMSPPRGAQARLGNLPFHKEGNNLVTHPLAGGFRLRLPQSSNAEERMELEDVREMFEHQEQVIENLGPVEWADARSLKDGFRVVWRRFRDELAEAFPRERLLWERIPADTRAPDHSIWEHLKVASALAFLDRGSKQEVPPEKEPWLFTFSLTPVQEFIQESRKSRDLWASSFLLADLVWHAMLPVVEHYGPDAIVYPDLRANPRVDNWLWHEHRNALSEKSPYPITHAALLPETFVAILPRGGAGHLRRLEDVARESADSMQKRWQDLAGLVRGWLAQETSKLGQGWMQIWDRQHERPAITSYWSAVHWQAPGQVDRPEELARLSQGGALLAQNRDLLPPPSSAVQALAKARAQRLGVWMPAETWTHYERARTVFGQVNLGYLQNERGFDYALTHHELRVRQGLRKQGAHFGAEDVDEPGEKCTQCHRREALFDRSEGLHDTIDNRRARVREFWQELDEDGTGAERLCGVCAFKRFLVDAGGTDQGLNAIWGDPQEPGKDADSGGKVRFPFPSTSAVAAQEFLAAAAESRDPDVQQAMYEVVAAHRRTDLPRTLFAETLPRLDGASKKAPDFLRIEAQESVFPDALQTFIDRAEGQAKRPYRDLQDAVRRLRAAVKKADLGDPDTHFAVVMLDGDHMGKLLRGDPTAVGARWRDAIHPWVTDKLANIDDLAKAGWPGLLDAPRLMGPSLHAFISRALADFSHRMVPWVVEQEYGGRLIYCGGDDVLAMAPARDALPMAARLQQLFSAAWIVDTRPELQAWSWRRGDTEVPFEPEKARWRFAIPKRQDEERDREGKGIFAIELPVRLQDIDGPVHPEGENTSAATSFDGQVLAGLGPGCSLSASIVYGHFKTQLSTMLRRGRHLIEEVAKKKAERGAVALAHHSRGGLKTEIALKWNLQKGGPAGKQAHVLLGQVIEAFRKDDLPTRLPYKLREASASLLVADDPDKRRTLAQGLLKHALDCKVSGDLEQAVLDLWLAGFDYHAAHDAARCERAVDGLLLCRYLASHGGDEE